MATKVLRVDPSPDLEPFAVERAAIAQAGGELVIGNAPAYRTDDVAEHAIALLLATARRVPWQERQSWAQARQAPATRPASTCRQPGVSRASGLTMFFGRSPER